MAQSVYENSQDDDTRRYVPDEVYDSVEEAREAIAFLMSRYDTTDGPFVYPIITNDSGKNIGYVQLCKLELEEVSWEIGYHIAKDFTGKGYATEAVKAFLPAMAQKLNLKEVYGICLAENTASVRVLEKCGFAQVYHGLGNYQGKEAQIIKAIWKNYN
jgi:RimJ/RimL family protein N-acetyltransferase